MFSQYLGDQRGLASPDRSQRAASPSAP